MFLYLFSPASSLLLGWFVDFEDNISHRVHEVTFGLLFTMVLVGIVAQIRSPGRNVAGIQQALAVTVVLVAVVTASTGWEWTALFYLIPVLTIAILHPARREVFNLRPRIEAGIGKLMLLATMPLFLAFIEEFSKAQNEVRGHQAHWGGVAAFALGTLVVGFLAASKQPGWLVSAWSVAVAAIVFGGASMVFRFDASARPDLRAILIIVWGVLLALATERARVREAGALMEKSVGSETVRANALRRRSKGRLLGGVAGGVANRYGWNVWVVRGVLVILTVPVILGWLLPVAPIAYAVAWWRIPREPVTGRSRLLLPTFGRALARLRYTDPSSWVRRLQLGVGGAAFILLGFAVFESARSFTAPPVPHDIESLSPSSCLACHATGVEHAPIIDPFTHNFHSDFADRRMSIPFCGECHDLPDVSAQPAANHWGAPGLTANAVFEPLPGSALAEITDFLAGTRGASRG